MPAVKIKGMRCPDCQETIARAISHIPGVTAVTVTLEPSEAMWKDADPHSPVAMNVVKEAIRRVGYDPD